MTTGVLLVILFLLRQVFPNAAFCVPQNGLPVLTPIGKENGIYKGRVCWSYRNESTTWNGQDPWTNFWWMNIVDEEIDRMLNETILCSAGTGPEPRRSSLANAWENLFIQTNKRRYGVTKGYTKGEKISIKVNLNGNDEHYNPIAFAQVSPQMMKSLLRHLVHVVGAEESDIYLYDASRFFSRYLYDPPYGIGTEFPGVRIYDNWGNESYVEPAQKQDTQQFYFSNEDIPDWNSTRLPQFVQDSRYMILVSSMRGHTGTGFTASGKNHFGSIAMNPANSDCSSWLPADANLDWCPEEIHTYVNGNHYDNYSPLVDLLGSPELGNKTVIFLMDAIYAGYQQTFVPVRYAQQPFDNDWVSSIFASQDPVALDSVMFDFLNREANVPFVKSVEGCNDNYLHEAALANNPPSGTFYRPDGVNRLPSLGVHEHWDNETMQYSRNLGLNYGIELIKTWEGYWVLCDTHYYGDDCNVTSCSNIWSNETDKVCNGHGNCEEYNICSQCRGGYMGGQCAVYACGGGFSNETVCSGHGNCASPGDACQCTGGYTAPNCSTPPAVTTTSEYSSSLRVARVVITMLFFVSFFC